jgi:hypothetical protein
MNPTEVKRWLADYGRAWETKDTQAALRLSRSLSVTERGLDRGSRLLLHRRHYV